MAQASIEELEALLPTLRSQYHRLLLVVGAIGSGKTALLKALCSRQGLPYLNLNLTLSQHLLDLTVRDRPLRVRRLLAELIDKQPGDTVVLDNIELLFDPALHQDPLACLQALSRNRTLVAAWGGTFSGAMLTYAEPGHPEYRRYEHPEALILPLP